MHAMDRCVLKNKFLLRFKEKINRKIYFTELVWLNSKERLDMYSNFGIWLKHTQKQHISEVGAVIPWLSSNLV